jgi:hypothetical protein
MGLQNEQVHSPPRRGGEPPGAKRGGRGLVRRFFVQSHPRHTASQVPVLRLFLTNVLETLATGKPYMEEQGLF